MTPEPPRLTYRGESGGACQNCGTLKHEHPQFCDEDPPYPAEARWLCERMAAEPPPHNRMTMSQECKHAQHRKCESSECWCVCHPANKPEPPPEVEPLVEKFARDYVWGKADHECGGLHPGSCRLCDEDVKHFRRKLDALIAAVRAESKP